MGSNHDSSDGLFKIRPRLADVTNCPSKRPFSLVSSGGGDSQFTKQMRLGVESLAKSKIQMQLGAHSQLNKEVLLQPKENQPILFPSCDDTSSSCQKPGSPSEGSEEKNPLGMKKCEFGGKVEGIAPTDCAVESGDKDICVAENSGSPRCRAVQMPSISASNDSNFRGLKPCSGHKGDGASNPVTDAADIKSCTCSLCSKAAYIWSDLHYQDAKGRLSAIKKSQKEAKLIIQKFSGLEDTVMHGQHQSEESLNLELSLVHQWKSLFVQMQNMYAQESSQLTRKVFELGPQVEPTELPQESSFESLKDLRERCKTDLDSNDNSHREKQ